MSMDERVQNHMAKKTAEAKAEAERLEAEAVERAAADERAAFGDSEAFQRVLQEIAPLAVHAIQGCVHGTEDAERLRSQGAYQVLDNLLNKFGRSIEHVIARSVEAEPRQPESETTE